MRENLRKFAVVIKVNGLSLAVRFRGNGGQALRKIYGMRLDDICLYREWVRKRCAKFTSKRRSSKAWEIENKALDLTVESKAKGLSYGEYREVMDNYILDEILNEMTIKFERNVVLPE